MLPRSTPDTVTSFLEVGVDILVTWAENRTIVEPISNSLTTDGEKPAPTISEEIKGIGIE